MNYPLSMRIFMQITLLTVILLSACNAAPSAVPTLETSPATTSFATPVIPTATPIPATATVILPTATMISILTSTPSNQSGLITFNSNRDGAMGLYAINADGSGDAEIITFHPFDEYYSSWSPDGNKIVLMSGRDAVDPQAVTEDIYVINRDGTGAKRLTNDPLGASCPNWCRTANRSPLVRKSRW